MNKDFIGWTATVIGGALLLVLNIAIDKFHYPVPVWLTRVGVGILFGGLITLIINTLMNIRRQRSNFDFHSRNGRSPQ